MKIREDLTAIYQSAKVPILMVIGKEDPALDYKSLINQTQHTAVKVIEFPDGHMSHIENTNDLIVALKEFIKST